MIIERKRRPAKKKSAKEVKYIKYGCPSGHYRIEKAKLEGDMPFCTTCHMTTGKYVRIKYISTKRG